VLEFCGFTKSTKQIFSVGSHLSYKFYIFFFSEMRNLHRRARENAMRIFQENENLRIDLENKRRELNLRAKELEKMSAENANDRKTLDDEKQKVS
jgi:hypothetical protein